MNLMIKTPKQKRNILIVLSVLSLLSSLMELIGLFGSGLLPPYVGMVGSVLLGIAAIKMDRKILENDRVVTKKPLWLKIVLGGLILIVSVLLVSITFGLYVNYQNELAYKASDRLAAELFDDLMPNWTTLTYADLSPHLSPTYIDEDDQVEILAILDESQKLMRYRIHKPLVRDRCKVSYDDSIACTYSVSTDYTSGEALFEFHTQLIENQLLITNFSISSRVFN